MSLPTVGVLALQGNVREHLDALRASGAIPLPVRRAGGLVLPGGESTTMSKLLDVFELLEPLRARLRAGMPAYGSCAGMILLADRILDGRPDQHQLGGLDVVVRRNAFGRQVDSFETDLEFRGVPDGPMHAVFIRAPWVEKTGTSDGSGTGEAAGRAVAVRQGAVLATAFHPELTGDRRVHGLFVDMVRATA